MTTSKSDVNSSLPESNAQWLSLLDNKSKQSVYSKDSPQSSPLQQSLRHIDFTQLYHQFYAKVKELNYIYFDDMVPFGLQLITKSTNEFHTNPEITSNEILSFIQTKYQFFFCDEFQDTNR